VSTDQSVLPRGASVVFTLAAIVVIAWGLYHAQAVIVPLLIAVFLAVLGTPLLFWLERKRVPSILAVMIVVALMITAVLSLGLVVAVSVGDFSEALPFYQERMQEQVYALEAFLNEHGIEITEKVLLEYVNPGAVMSVTANLLATMGAALSNTILILLMVTFILLEASSFPVKLRSIIGDPGAKFPRFTKFAADLKHYMVIKTVIGLVTGILIAIWLSVLGVDFPFLWGFLAFVLNYVPNLGSIFAAIPAVLLAMFQLGFGSAALAAGGYMAVNFIMGNVIELRVMGRRLSMSTLAVFLSLVVWGSLLGPVGMVLCIPITMTLKLACETREDTRWIAVLLGPPTPSAKSSS
jgi:AI-2 transport protein TqsA